LESIPINTRVSLALHGITKNRNIIIILKN
jgi:hypothetical protein